MSVVRGAPTATCVREPAPFSREGLGADHGEAALERGVPRRPPGSSPPVATSAAGSATRGSPAPIDSKLAAAASPTTAPDRSAVQYAADG
jgi:hypothetical protein